MCVCHGFPFVSALCCVGLVGWGLCSCCVVCCLGGFVGIAFLYLVWHKLLCNNTCWVSPCKNCVGSGVVFMCWCLSVLCVCLVLRRVLVGWVGLDKVLGSSWARTAL